MHTKPYTDFCHYVFLICTPFTIRDLVLSFLLAALCCTETIVVGDVKVVLAAHFNAVEWWHYIISCGCENKAMAALSQIIAVMCLTIHQNVTIQRKVYKSAISRISLYSAKRSQFKRARRRCTFILGNTTEQEIAYCITSAVAPQLPKISKRHLLFFFFASACKHGKLSM